VDCDNNWVEVKPVIDNAVRYLCIKPYYNHPKGCPNYGRRCSCPPYASMFGDEYDLDKPVFAIINMFFLQDHVFRMAELHPDWSERQLKCVLYWQGGARKQLAKKCAEFLKEHPGYNIETCPEAMGVNVTATLKNVGIQLEWPPVIIARQVALAGVRG
jgi:predicted metal-binding protein